MNKFKISLKTGNKFWTPKGLGAMGMDPNRAIAELVANSLDWRCIKKDKIDPLIQVIISKKSIEVRDNGVGMTAKELQDAIQVSVSNESTRTSLRIRKGMFGMGMKVACLSLGWKIFISSRSKNESNKENVLFLDTRKLDDNSTSNNYRESIVGETKENQSNGPLGEWKSGTSIQITDITHRNITAIAIKDSLQEIFNPEINIENAKIEIFDLDSGDSYLCEKTSVQLYEKSIIKLDELNLFVKDDESGKKIKIKGFLGLMKSGASGTGKWGLHLFKNNQIIERFHQLPIRLNGLMPKNPHPVYARTYGEIHLDMCKPAFHKVGFDYSTGSWKQVQQLLAEHISQIMSSSESFRKGDYEKAQKSIKAVQKHKRAVKRAIKKIKSSFDDPNIPDDAIVLPTGHWFTIVEPIFDSLGENEKIKPWIYHFRQESKELAIIINKESSVYLNLIQPYLNDNLADLLISWAISDCLLVLLYDKFEFSLSDAISFRDEQLLKLTSKEDA